MARSKAQKRANKRKRHAERIAKLVVTPATRRVSTRGRQRLEAGPTPQTVAKLKPDTLVELRALIIDGEPFLDATLVEAAHQVLATWRIIVGCTDHRSGHPGGGGADLPGEARALEIWRRWCGQPQRPFASIRTERDYLTGHHELFKRCGVGPSVIVGYLLPADDPGHRPCDRDPKGAAGVLKKALEWWKLASRDVGRNT